MPHELTKIKKKKSFWSVIFSYSMKQQWKFLDWIVMWEEKWILYDSQQQLAQWLGWDEAPKHFPKPNKKRSWSLVACCPSDPLQLSESWWNHYIWEAQQISEIYWKLQHLQPTLVNRKGLILLHDRAWPRVAQPTLQKLNELGYKVFLHPPYSPDLSPRDYHFLEHLDDFTEKMLPQLAVSQKMLSKSLSNPKAQIFMLQK